MQSLAFTLLEPGLAIIAGALAGFGVLFFYFLRLRRRPVRVSSTFLWTSSVADLQVNVPFRWVRFSWLLFLQLAAVACLAVALGRPVLSGTGETAESAILLIDRSASMQSLDGSTDGTTRLALAKRQARDVLKRLPSETRVLVAGFASSATALTGFTRDRGLARGAVDSIEATDEPGDLSAAFELVRALAGSSSETGEKSPAKVLLLSDGGFAGRSGERGIGNAALEFVPVAGASAPTNVGIVAMGARRDYADPAVVRLFARLQSTLETSVIVPVECRVGGEVIEQKAVEIGPALSGGVAEASATFEFLNSVGGLVTVSIGRADDLASDDTAGLMLSAPSSLRVLLVRPNVAVDAMDEVLEAALESLAPARLRTINAGEYEQGGPATDDELLVFDRVRPTRIPALPSISFGATVPIPGLGMSEPEGGSGASGFVYWLRSHPLMRYVVLSDVWVARAMPITLPDEQGSNAEVRCVPLAMGEAGPLIVLAEQAGVRRVVVGFDIGQSNWVKDASFHIFLKNAVDYLTLAGDDSAGAALKTTEVFSVRPAAGASAVEVKGPKAFSREISSSDRVTLGPLSLVGVYELGGVEAADSVAAVNLLDPRESRLGVASSLDLAGGAVAGTRASDATPREIWAWFVLAGVALLCVEWTLYALRMRV